MEFNIGRHFYKAYSQDKAEVVCSEYIFCAFLFSVVETVQVLLLHYWDVTHSKWQTFISEHPTTSLCVPLKLFHMERMPCAPAGKSIQVLL